MSATVDFCLALHRANASLQLRLDEELGTFHGIGYNDFALLSWLAQADEDRAPMPALTRPLGQRPSAVLRQVIALEKIGLVERNGTAGQRQAVLRPAGRSLLSVARETVERVCAQAVEAIDPAALGMTFSTMTALSQAPTLASP
jgi:MarR family transcriptional regulator, organic hydroperoxide resistance regulator